MTDILENFFGNYARHYTAGNIHTVRDADGKWFSEKAATYYECTVKGHNKFWAVIIEERADGFYLVRKWGAIGTKGQRHEKRYVAKEEVEREMFNLVSDKLKEGYKPIF